MRIVRTGLAGLVILAAACGSGRTAPTSPAPESGKTMVEIDNQNISDMSVYLLDRGTRVYLGQAGGLAKTALTIPSGVVRGTWEVRLLAEPIGGLSSFRTPRLMVPPGQNVYWSIGSTPATSSASAG